jgi:ribosomal protein S18 acetylase RimI-like enzyme
VLPNLSCALDPALTPRARAKSIALYADMGTKSILARSKVRNVKEFAVDLGHITDLGLLEPLWVAVHHQHQQAMPALAPYVTDADTWRERRALYQQLFTEHDPVLLLGRHDDQVVGYGLGYTMPVTGTWLADTWTTGARIGEIESLSVLPEYRGQGLGSKLLEQLHERLQEQGASDFIIGALPGNKHAIRLYQRHGYTPTWLYLSRLQGRDEPGQ